MQITINLDGVVNQRSHHNGGAHPVGESMIVKEPVVQVRISEGQLHFKEPVFHA